MTASRPADALAAPEQITRDDLEFKFRQLQDTVTGKIEAKKTTILTTIGVVGFLVLAITYAVGRKSGRKKSTLVEIRRL